MTIGPPRGATPYPMVRLNQAKAKALAEGKELIDFGIGDPRDPTPAFIRQALIDSIPEVSSYPLAAGLPELRTTIAGWIDRRFGVTVDSNSEILPTLGSKEIIHSLGAYLITEERDTVLVPTPAYPVYERGAQFYGLKVAELPLLRERSFLPDFDSLDPNLLQRTALLWLNYPNNPTGATAPLSLYEEAGALAREHGFTVASDEAYSEIWFEEPPVSALQISDTRNVVAVNTLSKRSCMTGYRSGFVAGDPDVILRLTQYRPTVGVTPQSFVQNAAIAAWSDEEHVDAFRALWRAKRDLILPILQSKGFEVTNPATFFLWIPVPDGETSTSFAERLFDAGIVVSPGVFFGEPGEGFVRMALVPTLSDCERAAEILKEIL